VCDLEAKTTVLASVANLTIGGDHMRGLKVSAHHMIRYGFDDDTHDTQESVSDSTLPSVV